MSKIGSSSSFHDVFIKAQGVYVTVGNMLQERGFDPETNIAPPDDLMHQVQVLAEAVIRLAESAEAIAKRLELKSES